MSGKRPIYEHLNFHHKLEIYYFHKNVYFLFNTCRVLHKTYFRY